MRRRMSDADARRTSKPVSRPPLGRSRSGRENLAVLERVLVDAGLAVELDSEPSVVGGVDQSAVTLGGANADGEQRVGAAVAVPLSDQKCVGHTVRDTYRERPCQLLW